MKVSRKFVCMVLLFFSATSFSQRKSRSGSEVVPIRGAGDIVLSEQQCEILVAGSFTHGTNYDGDCSQAQADFLSDVNNTIIAENCCQAKNRDFDGFIMNGCGIFSFVTTANHVDVKCKGSSDTSQK